MSYTYYQFSYKLRKIHRNIVTFDPKQHKEIPYKNLKKYANLD